MSQLLILNSENSLQISLDSWKTQCELSLVITWRNFSAAPRGFFPLPEPLECSGWWHKGHLSFQLFLELDNGTWMGLESDNLGFTSKDSCWISPAHRLIIVWEFCSSSCAPKRLSWDLMELGELEVQGKSWE